MIAQEINYMPGVRPLDNFRLEIVMRRYERASTILTSNRPLEDWAKIFGDTPAVAAFLDRLMHHSHLIEIRGKSYRLHEHAQAARTRKAKPAV